jgi:hypothetical protein
MTLPASSAIALRLASAKRRAQEVSPRYFAPGRWWHPSAESAANVFALTHVVIADCRTDSSGSTMDHQPEATVLVAL